MSKDTLSPKPPKPFLGPAPVCCGQVASGILAQTSFASGPTKAWRPREAARLAGEAYSSSCSSRARCVDCISSSWCSLSRPGDDRPGWTFDQMIRHGVCALPHGSATMMDSPIPFVPGEGLAVFLQSLSAALSALLASHIAQVGMMVCGGVSFSEFD